MCARMSCASAFHRTVGWLLTRRVPLPKWLPRTCMSWPSICSCPDLSGVNLSPRVPGQGKASPIDGRVRRRGRGPAEPAASSSCRACGRSGPCPPPGSSRAGGRLGRASRRGDGKRDPIHHHLLETISEAANVLELRQKLLYTTPSGWWKVYKIALPRRRPLPECPPESSGGMGGPSRAGARKVAFRRRPSSPARDARSSLRASARIPRLAPVRNRGRTPGSQSSARRHFANASFEDGGTPEVWPIKAMRPFSGMPGKERSRSFWSPGPDLLPSPSIVQARSQYGARQCKAIKGAGQVHARPGTGTDAGADAGSGMRV